MARRTFVPRGMERSFDTDAGAVLESACSTPSIRRLGHLRPRSHGSFLGSWKVSLPSTRAHRPDFDFSAAGEQIAQCAVTIAKTGRDFLDRLHILPAHAHRWAWCLQTVIERCGPADRLRLVLEPRAPLSGPARGPRVRRVAGRRGLRRRSRRLRGVGQLRGLSPRHQREHPPGLQEGRGGGRRVLTRRGSRPPRRAGLVRLRREVMRRNREPYYDRRTGRGTCSSWWRSGKTRSSRPSRRRRPARPFFGVRFGNGIYYLGGGTRDRNQGSAGTSFSR